MASMCTLATLSASAIPTLDYYIRYGARAVEFPAPFFTATWNGAEACEDDGECNGVDCG